MAVSKAAATAVSTRKDVGAKYRHNMRLSVQLSSASGVDSKLGLTMVRSSLQPAPELPALDRPPVSKKAVRLLWRFLTSGDLDLKIGAITFALENVYTNSDFSTFFCFRVTSPYGTDGQTDGRIDVLARGVMRPIRRPHNNATW